MKRSEDGLAALDILVPVIDVLTGDGPAAAYYGAAISRNPDIRFHWPSRGPDLGAARAGRLAANARPFAIDRARELDLLTEEFAGDVAPYAKPLFASALALQGTVFDAVDVPSTLPIAHLVRTACENFGILAGRVNQNWLGTAADAARHSWPDPVSDRDLAGLEAHGALSDAAAEARHAAGIVPPPCANGAPAYRIPPAALLDLAALPDGEASGRAGPCDAFCFIGMPRFGLRDFFRMVAALPAAMQARARIPADLPLPLLAALRADAPGLEIRRLAPGEPAVLVDTAPARLFDLCPWAALSRGSAVILSQRGWTAAVIEAAGAEGSLPQLDPAEPAAAAAALAAFLESPRRPVAPGPLTDSRGPGLSDVHGGQRATPPAPPRRLPETPTLRPMLAASRPYRAAAAAPGISFIVVGTPMAPAFLARTVANLARMDAVPAEALVVVDETAADDPALCEIVAAGGGFFRLVRQPRDAPVLRAVQSARAAIVFLLAAGDMTDPRLAPWLVRALGTSGRYAAVPAWAPVWSAQPGRTVASGTAATLAADPAATPVLGLVRSAALDAGEWDEGNGLAAAPHLLHALVARHGEACVSPPGAQSPPLVYVAGERVTGDEDGLGR